MLNNVVAKETKIFFQKKFFFVLFLKERAASICYMFNKNFFHKNFYFKIFKFKVFYLSFFFVCYRWNLFIAICVITGAVFVVISIIVFNPWAAMMVIIVVISMTIELAGFMGATGVKLNPISAVTLISAVGIGMFYCIAQLFIYLLIYFFSLRKKFCIQIRISLLIMFNYIHLLSRKISIWYNISFYQKYYFFSYINYLYANFWFFFYLKLKIANFILLLFF